MKIAVRYQSRGGNTKTVAEGIAKSTGVTAEPISKPLDEQVDILFVGCGVYTHDIDEGVKNFLKTLDPMLVKSVAAFSTAGVMDGAKRIKEVVKEQGINVVNEALPFKAGIRNHRTFSRLGGKSYFELKDKEINAINDFVRKVIG